MRQQAWNVFVSVEGHTQKRNQTERFKLLDTVFFDPSMDAEDVKRALVDHDGMPANILVRKEA